MITYLDGDSPFLRIDHYGAETRRAGTSYLVGNRRKHNLDAVVLQYIEGGQLQVKCGGQFYTAGANEALLLINGEESEYGLLRDAQEDATFCWVELRGPGVQEHWRILCAEQGPVLRDGVRQELRKAYALLLHRAVATAVADPLDAAQEVYRFILLLHRLRRETLNGSAVTPVQRAIAKLVENPLHNWSLKELASEAGCTRDHLTRVFTVRFGLGPKEWLLAQRVSHAIKLLGETNLPVQEIARQTGAGSPHTLIRLVSRATGLSPTEYRTAIRTANIE